MAQWDNNFTFLAEAEFLYLSLGMETESFLMPETIFWFNRGRVSVPFTEDPVLLCETKVS